MTLFESGIAVLQHDGRHESTSPDVCNLLQIAASALHLVEHHIESEQRPLIHASLAAIRQIGGAAHIRSMRVAVSLTRRISQ